MIEDIVQRLRDGVNHDGRIDTLHAEAADEIDKLRQRLRLADAALRSDTPVEPMPVVVSGSGSVTPVSYAKSTENRVDWNAIVEPPVPAAEPVAWGVVDEGGLWFTRVRIEDAAEAFNRAMAFTKESGGLIPLYRSPTLTDAEREAVRKAAGAYALNDDDAECGEIAATLRGLLARLA